MRFPLSLEQPLDELTLGQDEMLEAYGEWMSIMGERGDGWK